MSIAANEVVAGTFNPVEERCDRCGARGYVKAVNGDSTLIFCNHHGNEYELGLVSQGFVVTVTKM